MAGLVDAGGVVQYKGAPLETAFVNFHPASGGNPAYAYTDAQGKFQLTTQMPADGAMPGEYVVTVVKEKSNQPEQPPMTYEERKRFEESPESQNVPDPVFTSVVPKKYNTKDSSPLKITIPPKGDKNISIDITD
jgi:hypothetical protein